MEKVAAAMLIGVLATLAVMAAVFV